MIFQQQLPWTTHPAVLSGSSLAPLLLSFPLFIEVQVSFLCWLNSMEDRNRWVNLKMLFFQTAVGEMWLLGHEWKPSLGFSLSVGAQGLAVPSGTSTPKLLGRAAAFAGNCDSPCVQLSLECPNSHCSFSSAAAKPHKAPVKGRRARQKSAPVCPQNFL